MSFGELKVAMVPMPSKEPGVDVGYDPATVTIECVSKFIIRTALLLVSEMNNLPKGSITTPRGVLILAKVPIPSTNPGNLVDPTGFAPATVDTIVEGIDIIRIKLFDSTT
jgi:hypothetical protein